MPQFDITVTRKTVEVYRVSARNGVEAAAKLGAYHYREDQGETALPADIAMLKDELVQRTMAQPKRTDTEGQQALEGVVSR